MKAPLKVRPAGGVRMTLECVPRLPGGVQVTSTPKRIRILANVKNYRGLWKVAVKDGCSDPLQWFLAHLKGALIKKGGAV